MLDMARPDEPEADFCITGVHAAELAPCELLLNGHDTGNDGVSSLLEDPSDLAVGGAQELVEVVLEDGLLIGVQLGHGVFLAVHGDVRFG
ncbi:hypothetical protein ES703_90644 [subsurface metagenome]